MDNLQRERKDMVRDDLCCIACLLNLFSLIGVRSVFTAHADFLSSLTFLPAKKARKIVE